MRNALPLVMIVLVACGDPSESEDAGGMDAATLVDAGALPDAGRTDAGGEDASTIDPEDGGTRDDAGIDCSLIGCGAPSVCGACTAPCGCCFCGDGEEIEIDGRPYVCSGGCYMPRGTLGNGDVCTMTSECGAGLSCCYPCGVPDCDYRCEPTCDESGGAPCSGGCLLRP